MSIYKLHKLTYAEAALFVQNAGRPGPRVATANRPSPYLAIIGRGRGLPLTPRREYRGGHTWSVRPYP